MKRTFIFTSLITVLLLGGCSSNEEVVAADEPALTESVPTDAELMGDTPEEQAIYQLSKKLNADGDWSADDEAAINKLMDDQAKEQENRKYKKVTPIEKLTIGESRSYNNYLDTQYALDLKLNSAEIYDGSAELLKPKNNRFIVANITVTNTGTEAMKQSDIDWMMKANIDDADYEIKEFLDATQYNDEDAYIEQELQVGDSITFDIAYDLPASADGYTLEYRGDYIRSDIDWTFKFQADQSNS